MFFIPGYLPSFLFKQGHTHYFSSVFCSKLIQLSFFDGAFASEWKQEREKEEEAWLNFKEKSDLT